MDAAMTTSDERTAETRAPEDGAALTEPPSGNGAVPPATPPLPDPRRMLDELETRDWLESLRDVFHSSGPERISALLSDLQLEAQRMGAQLPVTSQTPYVNTIPASRQPTFPGDGAIERRIKSVVRWNAMAMVVEANAASDGIGGHISTFASAATLYEVGFQHFFRGPDHPGGADLVYFQGHASPGIYARAYLEGRLSAQQVHNFRREMAEGGGLSSYPHPWLMPEFWQFPTVSMGLGPLLAAYQARFIRYLDDRGLRENHGRKVWAFLGDGEFDEPEALASISMPAREKLDNLIFVINCNLQRLDGPVRGNGRIMQELEAIFRGAGWNVIKVIWGRDWDALLENDHEGLLARRMGEVVDGEYQKYVVAGGAYIREHFWGTDPRLLAMVAHLSDDELWRMTLGGHDPEKVYAAYKVATEHTGSPTVILARTIKGYGLGEAGEGRNVTHQQKKLNNDELLHFRDRFDVPLSDEEVANAPLYRFPEGSEELRYLMERRRALGGSLPQRRGGAERLEIADAALFDEFFEGTGDRQASTTMAFVRILAKLIRDPGIGSRVVPIVPDEARTFGMEAFFRQFGIYSHVGQLYEPVDRESLLYYKESNDGQILEEGITEAGAMASFTAVATAYATHRISMLPFYIYYSMFGPQRVGDLVWAAADSRSRGFLVGGTAGRTTLNGEGLQHQDGHSHVLMSVVPTVRAYDPAYAYEIAVLVRDGIRRMYGEGVEEFYYLTVGNENYDQPAMPEPHDEVQEGIVRGMYRFRASSLQNADAPRAQLLGSGAIHKDVVRAQELLEQYGVAADVWSVTSYTELRREAAAAERWNVLHPAEEPRVPYVTECLRGPGVVVAASDYVRELPDSVAKWVPGPLVTLGTDGFGRSETREALRDHFEVDHRWVTVAALAALARRGDVPHELVERAIAELGVDPEKPDPARL
jgi:pyruvate dehydrogenase E1 component